MTEPSQPSSGTVTRGADRGALPPRFRLREFELERVLGEGGFGVVYLALDTRLERRVAIKEYMPAQLATRDVDWSVHPRSSASHQEAFEAGLRSFVNEAKLLASFEHRSLVRVYQFWEEKGTAYMVMPFYASPTFKQWRKQRERPPDEAWLVSFLDGLIDAVDALHRQKCLHRDVAPDNVLVVDDRSPLLLDFGAARRVIGDLTQTLTVMLKPGFAPIEQYAETSSLKQGPWTDVYALAAVGYFAITGRAPPQSVGRIVHDELEPLGLTAAGSYSPHVLAALDAGLAVRPEARPQSMAALRALLFGEAQVDDSTVVTTRPQAPLPPAPATLHSTFKPTVALEGDAARRAPAAAHDVEMTVAADTAPTLARSTSPTFRLTPTQRERLLHPDSDETLVQTRAPAEKGRRKVPAWLWAAVPVGVGIAVIVAAWQMGRAPATPEIARAPAQPGGAPPQREVPQPGVTGAATSPALPAGTTARSSTAAAPPAAAAPGASPGQRADVASPVRPAPVPAGPASAAPTTGASPGAPTAGTSPAAGASPAPRGTSSTSPAPGAQPATRDAPARAPAPASSPAGAPGAATGTPTARDATRSAPAGAPADSKTVVAAAAPSSPSPPRVLRAPDGPPPLPVADTGLTALQVPGTVRPDEKEPLFSGYTCCNLHFSGDWFSDLNYSSYERVPAGTPIRITGYGRWRVLVELNGKPMRLGLDYGRNEETLAQFARKLTVDRDPRPRIASFPPIVQDAIGSAKLLPGMTREQVVMAVGFPSRYETASVNARQWKLWHTSRGGYTVVFDDTGRVKEIVVDDWLREHVVYEPKK